MPSTAAVALIQHTGNGDTLVSAIWAGDSRVYVLDSYGLAQLTVDDTPVKDPLDNLYEDGVLQNVFCADKPVELHCSTFRIKGPFLVFSATDGCFGYPSTPMEFEGLLLATLLHAKFPAEWEAGLADAISAVSGDDHALCLASYGFGSFPAIQQEFSERFAYLNKYYLQHVSKLPVTDRESRKKLWAYYRKGYARFIEDGLT